MLKNTSQTRRGDTIIEVMFGMAIFGLVAIATINLMNNGLAQSENNLESTMARNEIDAQASALNYIHSSYAYSGRTAYQNLWQKITDSDRVATSGDFQLATGGSDCSAYYLQDKAKPFVIDTSKIHNTDDDDELEGIILEDDNLTTDEDDDYTYPIVDSSDGSAHGIWIYPVKSKDETAGEPVYYDFYITSCWYGIGASNSTTLDTVIRLYNPDRRS